MYVMFQLSFFFMDYIKGVDVKCNKCSMLMIKLYLSSVYYKKKKNFEKQVKKRVVVYLICIIKYL